MRVHGYIRWTGNKTKANRDRMAPAVVSACRAFEAFFTGQAQDDLSVLLLDEPDLGSSDKLWNMLYINNHLYPPWRRAFCGLKCLGIFPQKEGQKDGKWGVHVQFNWLYRRNGSPERLIYLENEANGMKEMAEMQIKHEDDGGPAPKDSGTPIISGHTAVISMPEDDAIKCKMMLELQWDLACIAAMSGGAEHPELLPKPETLFAGLMHEFKDIGFRFRNRR
ncbi:hypothetical protein ACHAP8_011018 [Fusarium lateritium]